MDDAKDAVKSMGSSIQAPTPSSTILRLSFSTPSCTAVCMPEKVHPLLPLPPTQEAAHRAAQSAGEFVDKARHAAADFVLGGEHAATKTTTTTTTATQTTTSLPAVARSEGGWDRGDYGGE